MRLEQPRLDCERAMCVNLPKRLKSYLITAAKIMAIALGGALALSVLITLSLRWIAPPTTAFILGDHASEPHERNWVAWEDISPHLPMAIIAAEDQKFAEHHGFDFESIRETLDDPAEPRRGASTISQQLTKNLYLWPGRNWLRKGFEAHLTVLIETTWPKQRILEVYMNVVEFGPGIYGVGTASEVLFNKSPRDLTEFEAACLAAVLPSPRRMSAHRPSLYVIKRAFWIMEQMEQLGGEAYLAAM